MVFAASVVLCVVAYADSESSIDSGAAVNSAETERLGVGEGADALNGKKILFAGCSYTYYGGLIERTGASVFSQATRTSGETGYFVRLSRLNGVEDLTVTDWVYGGHDLSDIFDGEACGSGESACVGRCHLDDLVDRNYDIVILQEILTPGYKTPEQYVESLRTAMDVFLEVNPDTKFYMLAHHRLYQQLPGYAPITASVQLAKDQLGIEIIDWGALVYDVTLGNLAVPGSEIEYDYQSFVVSSSASDGYHQNILAGYISTIMTYATLTGETTVGQPYEFIYGLSSKYLNIDKFITSYYKYDDPDTAKDESKTNMKEIFYSPTDMLGLQVLAEQYLTMERWLDFSEYTVEFKAGDEVISSAAYRWGAEIEIPDAPEKPADGRYTYAFAGWDKEVSATCNGNVTYTAVYESAARKYTVTFLDDNGDVLSTGEYEWGEAVSAPTVEARQDSEYKYVFKSWDTPVSACDGDKTYTAVYMRVGIGYTVTFRDYDGTLISAATYALGATVLAPEAPTREDDNVYSYSFIGWDKEITVCGGDTEYTAVYSLTYIDYTVSFKSEDGAVILEQTYHWGDEITVPDAPIKPADNTYTYDFAGWGGDVPATCCGNADYTASYTATYIIYTVLFVDDAGEIIVTRNCKWGETVTPPTVPRKLSDDEFDYVFAGWDKEVTECRGTTSYTATYTAVPKGEADDTPSDEPVITPPCEMPADGADDDEGGFFAMVKDFFARIAEWFRGLIAKMFGKE